MPNFGMSIAKAQCEIEIVAVVGERWKIEPGVRGRVGEEKAIIDAPLVFVD